jgi:hypothetical protein
MGGDPGAPQEEHRAQQLSRASGVQW